MLKILFVVRGFYPDMSASGNLIFPLVKEMSKFSNVNVLAFSENNVTDNVDGIRVYRIKKNGNKYFNLIKRHLFFPYYNSGYVNSSKSAIEKLDFENNYDLIVSATYEEMIGLAIAKIDHKKKSCFLLEKFHETSKIKFIRVLQEQANKKLYKMVAEKLNFKFSLPRVINFLPSDYDNVFELEHPMIVDNIRLSEHKDKELLIYIGGIDLYQRNPWPIINFFQSVNMELSFEIYGYGNALSSNSVLPSKTKYMGLLEKSQINKVLNKASFLISIGNKELDIFPSKIFDYLSTGIPIVHFSQNDLDPYYDYLKDYDNVLILNLDALDALDALDEARMKFSDFIKIKSGYRDDYENIRCAFNKQTPQYNCKKILRIING